MVRTGLAGMNEYLAKHEERPKASLLVQPAPEAEPSPVHAPAAIRDAETGSLVAMMLRYEGDMAEVRRAFRAYPMSTVKRTAGFRTRTAAFGYVARRVHMKREGCRTCNGATAAPAAHRSIVRIGESIARTCAAAEPGQYEADMRTAARIEPGWRMGDTPWTSGVLNDTSPLPYHYDRNNLEPVWSAMLVARRQTRGGHLSIPEYGLTLECRDGDIVWFPGWHFIHGVTPIRRTDIGAYRYTCVYYAVAGMQDCLPAAEETARARRQRSHREDTLLDRQAELGLLDR